MLPVRVEDELGVWRTAESNRGVAMAGTATLSLDGHADHRGRRVRCAGCGTGARWRQEARLERLMAVVRTDDAAEDPGGRGGGAGAGAGDGGEAVLAAHEAAWLGRWQPHVTIEGDPELDRALRFATYHLNSAAIRTIRRFPSRPRLTGDAYLGHVFWDTESI